MSRSQPSEKQPNPCERWFEWNGSKGDLSYWDKAEKKRVRIALPFTFLLLDELKRMSGFDAKGNCRTFSNEVRDTTVDPFRVKSFNGGLIAEGTYQRIKEDCKKANTFFTQSLYLAFKREGSDSYGLGNLALQGAALSAWVDFKKEHPGNDIYESAITIKTYTEGQTGAITYRMPRFYLTEVSAAAEGAAQALDETLQAFLKTYLTQPKDEHVEDRGEDQAPPPAVDAADIPF